MGDYIKINRSILEWEWFHDHNTFRVFVYMILRANWKDASWKGILVRRGSFISSYSKLANEVDLTIDELRTALKHLKNTKEITIQTNRKYSVFTVSNYCRYQDVPTLVAEQIPNQSQTITKLLPTIEVEEEVKKGSKEEEKNKALKKVPKGTKENSTNFFPTDEKLNQTFLDYIDMRKKIKAPMTDHAIELAIKKIIKMSSGCGTMDNDIAIEILEQSILGSWKGLFELKKSNNGNTNKSDYIDKWRDV